jgi:hypothetical protein
MYKTANEAVDAGDEAAIIAFRDAVKLRRRYGELYQSDRFVKDLVSGKMGIDDAVKNLVGTGSIAGKKGMEKTYDAIIKAAGDQSSAVRSDLQAGFAKKILQQSTEGLEAGGENAYLSAAKTKKALEGLFMSNKNFSIKLFGEDNYNAAIKAIAELEPISKMQPSTTNPSGSGYAVLRVLNKIPLINLASKSFEEAGAAMKAGQVRKSFGDLINNLPITPQSRLFNPSAAGLIATSTEE